MRNPLVLKFFVFSFLFLLSLPAAGQNVSNSLLQSLPDEVEGFRAETARARDSSFRSIRPEDFNVTAFAVRRYRSTANGENLLVTVARTQNDSSAFALLTHAAQSARGSAPLARLDGVGRSGFAAPDRVMFFKGATFVQIQNETQATNSNSDNTVAFARAFAETLDIGADAVPPLVQHLPEFQTVQERAVYAVSLPALQEAIGGVTLLDELTFNSATEAVTALYDSSMRLVVVEYRTPQLAGDNDRRISARIEDLRRTGQNVPSLYRRTGNYLVFVFGAPNEAAAVRLADGVRYEQEITWLSENPFDLRQAQRAYDIAATSLILAAFKFSGIALLFCLSAGTIFGGIIFLRRRAQAASAETYTDAGGMVRLNIDSLTPQVDAHRPLLGEKIE